MEEHDQGQGQHGGFRVTWMNFAFRRKICKLKNQRWKIQNLHIRGRKVLIHFQAFHNLCSPTFPSLLIYSDSNSLLVHSSQITNCQVYLLYLENSMYTHCPLHLFLTGQLHKMIASLLNRWVCAHPTFKTRGYSPDDSLRSENKILESQLFF